MLKIILVFIAFALPSNAYAGSGSGRVTFLLVNHDTTPVWVNFNVENIMNSVIIVEQPDGRIYLVGLMSNILKKNSAVEHQSLATFIDRILKK